MRLEQPRLPGLGCLESGERDALGVGESGCKCWQSLGQTIQLALPGGRLGRWRDRGLLHSQSLRLILHRALTQAGLQSQVWPG